MRAGLTDEEQMLVDTVRAFVDKEVRPSVREVEHANTYPEAWIEQMKRIGIYGLAIPDEFGGSPVSMLCYVLVTQELARGWMSLAGAMGGHTVVAKLLSLFGTEEQKRQYLPPMATGELRATMALTEPSGGSDVQNMSTTALPDGSDPPLSHATPQHTPTNPHHHPYASRVTPNNAGAPAPISPANPDCTPEAPATTAGTIPNTIAKPLLKNDTKPNNSGP